MNTINDLTINDLTINDLTINDLTINDLNDLTEINGLNDLTEINGNPQPIIEITDILLPEAMVLDATVPDAMVLDATVPEAMVLDATVLDAMVPEAMVPRLKLTDLATLESSLKLDPGATDPNTTTLESLTGFENGVENGVENQNKIFSTNEDFTGSIFDFPVFPLTEERIKQIGSYFEEVAKGFTGGSNDISAEPTFTQSSQIAIAGGIEIFPDLNGNLRFISTIGETRLS